MPNGFTQDIYSGKNVSLRDYLMGVGRGMTFSIMQRDEGSGPVKLVEQKDSYHTKALNDAANRLAILEKMTSQEIEIYCETEYKEEYSRWKKYKEDREAVQSRYEYMLAQVEAWNCPPILATTKETAIKYLKESLEFDCGYQGSPPINDLVPGDWHSEQIKQAKNDIEYHRLEEAKETANRKERNMYIKTFLDSLPDA